MLTRTAERWRFERILRHEGSVLFGECHRLRRRLYHFGGICEASTQSGDSPKRQCDSRPVRESWHKWTGQSFVPGRRWKETSPQDCVMTLDWSRACYVELVRRADTAALTSTLSTYSSTWRGAAALPTRQRQAGYSKQRRGRQGGVEPADAGLRSVGEVSDPPLPSLPGPDQRQC